MANVRMGGIHLDGVWEATLDRQADRGWLARALALSGETLRIDADTGVRFDETDPDAAAFLDQVVTPRLH